jgi:hypothetical protein
MQAASRLRLVLASAWARDHADALLLDALARACCWAEYFVQCGDAAAVAAIVADVRALAGELGDENLAAFSA